MSAMQRRNSSQICAGTGDAFGQGMGIFLTLLQEDSRAGHFWIGKGAGKLARLHRHLRGQLQQFGLHLRKVGVFAEVIEPGAHRVKLAR